MENRRWTALALIVIGLGAVNFFYLSDVILLHSSGNAIVVGWKSAVAIVFANLVALAGISLVARNRRRR